MHIPDGVLSPVPCVLGWGVATAATWASLRRLPDRDLPRLAVLSAAFFALGAMHVRIGPGSVHFLLTGLLAMILGWRAFAAVLVGVTLHAVLLQHGGLTTIGVNACVLGLPALLVGAVTQRWGRNLPSSSATGVGALATIACYLVSMALFVGVGQLSDERLMGAFSTWAAAHAPVMVIEAIATATAYAFFMRMHTPAEMLVPCEVSEQH